jgi:hypothetical protein
MSQAQETMHRIGLGLIEERRHEVTTELENAKAKLKDKTTAVDSNKTILGRDILSVLGASPFHSENLFDRLTDD